MAFYDEPRRGRPRRGIELILMLAGCAVIIALVVAALS